eukprot:367820-Pelagomonas_calceolata.AAC.1
MPFKDEPLSLTLDTLFVFTGASGGGCWARGSRGWEKESPGVQEHDEKPSRSPLTLFLALS